MWLHEPQGDITVPDEWKDSFERHAMNSYFHEPSIDRLEHVANYLNYLVENQIPDRDIAGRTRRAVSILREAIREQEAKWAEEGGAAR
jgi:hypothetical protein